MADDIHLLKPPITGEQLRKRAELFAGMMKQTLTLNTASIIAVTALSGGFFDDPKWAWLLGISILCFILSITGCYYGLWVATMKCDETYAEDSVGRNLWMLSFFIGFMGFPIGLLLLGIFVWINTVG